MRSAYTGTIVLALAALAGGWWLGDSGGEMAILGAAVLLTAVVAVFVSGLGSSGKTSNGKQADRDDVVHMISRALVDGMAPIGAEIDYAITDSNRQALSVLEEFNLVVSRAHDHAAQVESIGQGQGKGDAGLAQGLGSKVREHLVGVRTLAEQQLEVTGETLGFAQTIVRLSSQMATIAATARMLSLNARVEAARAGEEALGFAYVARELGRLADELLTVNGNLGELGSQMAEVLPGVGSMARQLVDRCNMRLAALDAAVDGYVESTENITKEGQAALDEAKESSERLRDGAANILVHLQSQDKTTQRLSAVAEALRKLAQFPEEALDRVSQNGEAPGALPHAMGQAADDACKPLERLQAQRRRSQGDPA